MTTQQRFNLKLQFLTKCLKQSKQIQQNWAGAENFDNSFYVSFDRYYEHYIAGRNTEYYVLSRANFGIFLTFPNFLRSLVLS